MKEIIKRFLSPGIIDKGRRAKLVLRRLLLKLGGSVPLLSRYFSPIGRGLTTFKTWCTGVDTLSASGQRGLEGQYLRIRKSETVRRSPPISLDDNQRALFEKGIYYHLGGYSSQIPEVFLARIPKAKIWGPSFLVISPDNLIFADSIWADYLLEETGVLDRIKPLKVTYRSGSYALLGVHWARGYYHWVLDVLPRISVLERFKLLDQISLIVPEGMTNQQYDSLQMLGIPSNSITESNGEYYEVDLLYFPSVLSRTGDPSPRAVSWLRDRFFKHIRVPKYETCAIVIRYKA